jgi:hypothetical protein
MRGGKTTAGLLGVLLHACFMGNYDLLQLDSSAADGATPDAAFSADAMSADAGPPGPTCGAPDAGARPCDDDLCPPVLPTHFCAVPCELPSCDPCAACKLSCQQEGCAANCQPGRTCVYQCPTGIACQSICAAGATCDMECRDAKSCSLTCEAGSTCTIYCLDSAHCSVACKPGAHCVLGCFAANASCEFAECGGPVEQCGGAVVCNSFGCPAG